MPWQDITLASWVATAGYGSDDTNSLQQQHRIVGFGGDVAVATLTSSRLIACDIRCDDDGSKQDHHQ